MTEPDNDRPTAAAGIFWRRRQFERRDTGQPERVAAQKG